MGVLGMIFLRLDYSASFRNRFEMKIPNVRTENIDLELESNQHHKQPQVSQARTAFTN